MRNHSNIQLKHGVTLIELLVVIAVIGILASLLLVAVHIAYTRSKERIWRLEAPGVVPLISERLRNYYHSQSNYPAWTTTDLYQRGVFDNRIMRFLRSPNVTFTPFSSTDSDNKMVLSVVNIWPDEEFTWFLTKYEITKSEDPFPIVLEPSSIYRPPQ